MVGGYLALLMDTAVSFSRTARNAKNPISHQYSEVGFGKLSIVWINSVPASTSGSHRPPIPTTHVRSIQIWRERERGGGDGESRGINMPVRSKAAKERRKRANSSSAARAS
jgi:hypothetical protein